MQQAETGRALNLNSGPGREVYVAGPSKIRPVFRPLVRGTTDDSTINVLPVIQPSSLSVLLTASRSTTKMDVQQPPQVKCFENGVHLAGLDSPPG